MRCAKGEEESMWAHWSFRACSLGATCRMALGESALKALFHLNQLRDKQRRGMLKVFTNAGKHHKNGNIITGHRQKVTLWLQPASVPLRCYVLEGWPAWRPWNFEEGVCAAFRKQAGESHRVVCRAASAEFYLHIKISPSSPPPVCSQNLEGSPTLWRRFWGHVWGWGWREEGEVLLHKWKFLAWAEQQHLTQPKVSIAAGIHLTAAFMGKVQFYLQIYVLYNRMYSKATNASSTPE